MRPQVSGWREGKTGAVVRGRIAAMLKWIALPSLFVICTPAAAEVYRWLDQEGRVHFGDRPSPGARMAQQRPDLASVSVPASPGLNTETIDEARERARQRAAAREQAHSAVVQAGAILSEAKARRERGEEPLPGERRGVAGGGTRLGPGYFERQARLEDEVRRAQAERAAAQAASNSLR